MLEFNIIDMDDMKEIIIDGNDLPVSGSCECGSWFLICGWNGCYMRPENPDNN